MFRNSFSRVLQWNVLRNHVEEIDKAINENSQEVGILVNFIVYYGSMLYTLFGLLKVQLRATVFCLIKPFEVAIVGFRF